MAQSSHQAGRTGGFRAPALSEQALEQTERDAARAEQRNQALAKARRVRKERRKADERRDRRSAAAHLRTLRDELDAEHQKYDGLLARATELANRDIYDAEEDETWDQVNASHARISSLDAEIRQLEAQVSTRRFS